MNRIFENIKDGIAEAIFPSNIYCICCGSLIDKSRPYALCDLCVKKFHWIAGRTCEKCGKALPDTYRGRLCYDCIRLDHVFEKGFSCLTYGLHEREVLLDHKYNGKGYMAAKFGDILYDRISCEDIRPDVIIPVPISEGRLKKRGYNQSALMARQLSKRWGVPMDESILVRKKETTLLRSLNPADRRLVLSGAFAVRGRGKDFDEKSSGMHDDPRLTGKSVLLIDDIYTTGATVDTCSSVLMAAGADKVYVLTLMSGGNRRPDIESDTEK